MESEEEADEPLSEEDLAHHEALNREFEAEAERLYGPPAERRLKNAQVAAALVSEHGEDVIRSLLVGLSRLERPLCAHMLSENDLATTDLGELIQPFELFGLNFKVVAVEGDEYTVEIRAGYGNVGDGGRIVLRRGEDGFHVARHLQSWIS